MIGGIIAGVRNNIENVVEEVTRGMSSFKAKRLSVYLRYRYYSAKGLIDESEKSFKILNRSEQEEVLRLAKEGYIVRPIKEGNVAQNLYYDLNITDLREGSKYLVEVKHIESSNLRQINVAIKKANKQLKFNKGTVSNSFITLDLNESNITIEQAYNQISRMYTNEYNVKIVKEGKVMWYYNK